MALEDMDRQSRANVCSSILFQYEELLHPIAFLLRDESWCDECKSSIAIFDQYDIGKVAISLNIT